MTIADLLHKARAAMTAAGFTGDRLEPDPLIVLNALREVTRICEIHEGRYAVEVRASRALCSLYLAVTEGQD